MINKIISYSINNKFIIGLFIVALIGTGIWSMATINLGSVPDITNNQVQVITVAPNLGTEDIEQFVTYPVELAMANLPDVVELRSVSRFGLSVVTIVFEDEAGTYLPRQLVQEKLTEVSEEIPEGFGKPFMAPITTGLGEIYQYSIKVKEGYEDQYDAMELRTIQDWLVKRQMALVPGVVEVNAFGGYVKQYEVAINPDKLKSFGITMSQVFEALKANNANTGGAYIEKNHQANFIRGEGLARSIEDLENTLVASQNGTPVLVRDIAEKVGFGNQVRNGAFTQDGHESVGGQILMLKGESPSNVIDNVQERIAKIQKSLPEGLYIEPFLSRSELISRTTSTVEKNLIEGSLIVIFVLVLLLGSFRGGLITASVIPLSLLFAFILMKQFGVWANLMSLGAIDFGIIVDGAVIIVEGMVLQIHQRIQKSNAPIDQAEMDEMAYESGSTMMNSAFFGQLIILIVFTPILFLTGVEGNMFRPMAFTFGFAVLGAIILCLTYVPMAAALFLIPAKNPKNWFARFEHAIESFSDWIMAGLNRAYKPLLSFALRFKAGIIIGAIALLVVAGYVFSKMGGEFIPKLDEGDIAMQALIKPGSSLTESIEASKKLQNLVNEFPEVKTMISRIGVAEIPTDPMPMDIADSYIILEKDKSKWTSAESKEELIEKIKEKISVIPGVNFVFTQPVELRFNELLTGVREDVAVLNGLVLINKFNELKESGMTNIKDRIYEATHERLRPIILTATAAIMGFIPMAVSTSGGAEVQRPLATVVIGGLLTATFLTLVVVPVLYSWLEARKERKGNGNGPSYVNKSESLIVVLLSLGGFLTSNTINAQENGITQTITLEEAITMARENYPSLKESQAFIERERAMKGTSFDLGNTQVFTGKEELGNDLPGVQTTIGVKQGNIDLLSGFSKSRFYKERVQLGEKFYALNDQQLIRNVMQAYYRINYYKAQLRFAEQLDSVYTNFQTAAKLRYDSGETGRLEFIAASSEYQQIQVLRQQAYDDIEIAKLSLKQFLGVEQEIETVGLSYQPMDYTSILDSASVADNPILQYAMQNAEVSKANIDMEKSQFLPKFSLSYGRQVVDDISGFNTFQVGISIPLWYFPQKSRVDAAKADALVTTNQYLEQKAVTESRVSQLLKSLEKIQKTLDYYHEGALLLAEEQLSTAELASQEGEIDYVNYITILNSAIRIKQNHLQFINQYNQQAIEVQYQLGNL